MGINEQLFEKIKQGDIKGLITICPMINSCGWKLSWLNSNDNFEINGKTEFLYQCRLGNELQN